VHASLRREFSDPKISFADLIGPADWDEYCEAFAANAREWEKTKIFEHTNISLDALPAGLNANADRLVLSVLVSPRLITDGGVDGTLAQFPIFWTGLPRWRTSSFMSKSREGPHSICRRLFDLTFRDLITGAWTALFRNDTTVHPYAFDDRADIPVRSFPTKKILSFIKTEYQHIAVTSGRQSRACRISDCPEQPAKRSGGIAVNSDIEAGIHGLIDDELKRVRFVSPGRGHATA